MFFPRFDSPRRGGGAENECLSGGTVEILDERLTQQVKKTCPTLIANCINNLVVL